MIDVDASLAVTRDDAVRVEFGPLDHRQVDATGGRLGLAASSLDVASLTLVGLSSSPADVARVLGLVESGGFVHGSRWGLLEPADGQWRVAMLTAADPGATRSRIDVGRLSDRDVTRWGPLLDGRTFRIEVFVEATPGFAGIDARFVRGIVEGATPPTTVLVAPSPEDLDRLAGPPAPPGWYVDPVDAAAYRWWDGAGWTTHTSQP